MKVIPLLLSLLLVIQYTCWLPSFAAQASFDTSTGAIKTQVPVNKVGTLLLADATAILTATAITITAVGTSGASETVLQGQILNPQTTGTGSTRTIQGIANFDQGTRLDELGKVGKTKVKTNSGEVLEGPISEVTADGLTIAGQRILSSNLSCIDSPRAFEFTINLTGVSGAGGGIAGEAASISFKRCKVTGSASSKTEKVSKVGSHTTAKRVAVCVALLAIVAVAIAVPVAVACSRRGHNNNNDVQRQILLNQIVANQRASSSSSSTPAPVTQQRVVNTHSSSDSSSSYSSSYSSP